MKLRVHMRHATPPPILSGEWTSVSWWHIDKRWLTFFDKILGRVVILPQESILAVTVEYDSDDEAPRSPEGLG